MPEEKPKHTNRLINEKSPYLQQHAHNPVDWYPWGDEAFEDSRRNNKPIFLSIGYATCHWCHVMEREAFEDEEIAKEMNDLFINIKVDREELPQVDSLYMEMAQALMAGAAGWPLNLILTPELKPIFAATYLPPESRHGLIGMRELVMRIKELWNSEEREKVEAQSIAIVDALEQNKVSQGKDLPRQSLIEETAELLFRIADPVYGGIKGSPKFPIGYQQLFLQKYSAYSEDGRALYLAEKTLQMMAQGGIYDHIGGGFSRYSIDEKWLVPHFEKMLCDNAILSEAYATAWQLTGKGSYKDVATQTLEYVLKDMTHPAGGFYSAEDSESCGQEGLFYTWLYQDIIQYLGEDSELFCEFYNITPSGNFNGRNILNITVPLDEYAAKKNLDPKELKEKLQNLRATLWKIRETAPRPFKDTKIITSWNGMMIHSLALAGMTLDRKDYLESAEKGALFVKDNLWKNGKLLRTWIDGEAGHAAIFDDYAYIIRACITLFEADLGSKWLQWAVDLCDAASNLFKADDGAFYQTASSEKNMILRNIQYSDGSEPSGNAIHAENLLRLYELSTDINYLGAAEDILKAVNRHMEMYSLGFVYHLINLLRYYDPNPATLVVALNNDEANRKEIYNLIGQTFLPHRSVIWKRDDDQTLMKILPFLEKQKPIAGKTTLYICHKGICKAPLTDLKAMKKALAEH
jgi:uncharacterized protein